jgi:putative holliday junction resolvase
MIYNQIKEFVNTIKNNGRLAGLDVGTKTIGIAISDKNRNLSTPKITMQRKGNQKDIPLLIKFLEQNQIKGIIVGLPLTKNDKETQMSLFIRKFAENLSKKIELPIYCFDEYLSSFMAEDFMINTIGIKYKKIKKLVDQTAASFILQNFLDKLKNNS